MNVLMNNVHTHHQYDIKEHSSERTTFGDMFAVSLVSMYTISALVVSSWSAVLLLTGKNGDSSPIGFLVDLLHSSGII